MSDLTVACRLTPPELQSRRRTVLADFRAAQLAARELTDATGEGFTFQFRPSPGQLAALAELIDLERQCCPFFCFRLTVEPNGGPAWLALTGPVGTGELLTHELGFVRDPSTPPSVP